MALNITFQGKTYDLSTSSGMAAYSAAINGGTTSTAPASTTSTSTENLIKTYNAGGGTPLTTAQIGSAISSPTATSSSAPYTGPLASQTSYNGTQYYGDNQGNAYYRPTGSNDLFKVTDYNILKALANSSGNYLGVTVP